MIPDLARARAQLLAACREVLQHDPSFDPLAELVLERVSELGRGGMGVVWRVKDRRLGREAALKLLLPGDDPELRPLELRRFERESRITARLDHPAIPPVFGAGTTSGGERWLLMKLIRGEPLSTRLAAHDWTRDPRGDDERLWLREQLEVVVKVGEATAYAHGQHVAHRDLKPANVMVGRFGEVLVMDWGLAKELDRADSFSKELAALRADPELTSAGTSLGTPGYMPPEQIDGEATARSDVWALGAVLVAVLTGRPPVEGTTGLERITATLKGAVVLPRARRPGLPRELDSIAARALALDPEQRFTDAEAFVRDLRAFLAGEPVACHDYGRVEALLGAARRRPALLVGALGALLLLGAVVGLVSWGLGRARRAGDDARRAQVELARGSAKVALDAAARAPEGARTGEALRALEAAQRWRDLAPADPEAVAALASAASCLGEEALGGARSGRWPARRSGSPRATSAARGRPLTRGSTSGACRRCARRLARVSAELERLRSGALDDDPSGAEDALDVLARWEEPEVVALLARALEEEAASLEQGEARGSGRRDAAPRAVPRAGAARAAAPRRRRARQLPRGPAGRAGGGRGRSRAVPGRRRGRARPRRARRAALPPGRRLPPAARGRAAARRGRGPEPPCARRAGAGRRPRARAARARRRAEGDRAGAIEDCARLIASDDPRARANGLNLRGAMRAETDDLQGALADLSAALECEPGLALAWSNRAELRCRLGDPGGALEDSARALSLEPRTSQHWLVRGRVRHLLGEHRQAVEDLDQAVLFDPDLPQPHLLRARCRTELGDLPGALADLDRAVVLDPRSADPLVSRARLQLQQHDAPRALADCTRALELRPRDVELLVLRARARLAAGDPGGARADLARALELDPRNPEARDLVVEAGGTPPALGASEEATGSERGARAWAERGASSFQRRDWPGAIAAFERAVRLEPGVADLHANLGVARMEGGDVQGAIAALSSAIDLDPRSARALQNRGQARAKVGDHRGALVDFDRALELDPRYALALRERGKSRRSLDDAPGALLDFDRALELAPTDVSVHLARGDLRARQGDVAGALSDLRTFCERAPKHRDVPAARRRIAELEARR